MHRGCAIQLVVVFLSLSSGGRCADTPHLKANTGVGPNPELPAPSTPLIPTVHVATAKGWALDDKPTATAGMAVSRFATGLDHPRWLCALPNGDVLVAETNAPPRPQDSAGLKSQVMKYFMQKAGVGTPSANRITLLRDADGDGVAETRFVFLTGLNSPFGMTLVGATLFVANTDSLMSYPYREGQTTIVAAGTKIADLPAGPLNHHWTKNVIASPDRAKLYVTVGSNSNVAENGLDQESGRAAIWEIDLRSGRQRVFASGLRNPNGMAWANGTLWTVVNERDELGPELVPDYLTAVHDGGFYGWPYSYYGQHPDDRVQPPRPDLVATARVPDYALGAHTAALGLVSAVEVSLPARFKHGMFVTQHGSWNRNPFSGYKVIFVPFARDQPLGDPIDVLSGFVDSANEARGRPVGVVVDNQGALLVADDVGNIIWRVTLSAEMTTRRAN